MTKISHDHLCTIVRLSTDAQVAHRIFALMTRRELMRNCQDELLEILQPRGDEDGRNRRQLALMKQERLRYGRIHRDDENYMRI
jgi:hypothetical protein